MGDYFHACVERQRIRDEVFGVIKAAKIRIDATILENRKLTLRPEIPPHSSTGS
ncbi:MAG: hypothetical protein WDO56_34315 [Gammaproteobacteria bacterium]